VRLLIDFTREHAQRKGLIVYPRALRWELRERLLRAPELAAPLDPPARTASDGREPRPAQADGSEAVWLEQARTAILHALAVETGRPGGEIEGVEELADLGLDSLSIARVLLRIEEALGCEIASWERAGTRLFEVRALEAALVGALRTKAVREHRGQGT
jgi:acyl carrier protein